MKGRRTIASQQTEHRIATSPILSLAFAHPVTPDHVIAAIRGSERYQLVAAERKWPIEVLLDGLTFHIEDTDLAGKAGQDGFSGIEIRPGPHIEAGAHTMPVMRAWLEIAVALGQALPDLQHFTWHPAGHDIDPQRFVDDVGGWLSGKAFPIECVVTFETGADTILTTRGLAFFTGQELTLEAVPSAGKDADQRLLLRIANQLVHHGRLEAAEEVVGFDGHSLRLDPGVDGTSVRVSLG